MSFAYAGVDTGTKTLTVSTFWSDGRFARECRTSLANAEF